MDPQRSFDPPRAGLPVAPPPGVHEPVPGHRPGHAWIPGYWDWRNDRHVWIGGHWVPLRHGCHWRRHRWIPREGRWYLEPGGWVLDEYAAPERRERLEQEAAR
ncbi:MAG TPA: YXWGXW repeat-containing protein [Usitatibacter sp.]|nr:YXWGXW repeat-containing protein [Usitatibacter sp.]